MQANASRGPVRLSAGPVAAFYAVLAGLGVLWMVLAGPEGRPALLPSGPRLGTSLLGGAALAAVVLLGTPALLRLSPQMRRLAADIREILEGSSQRALLVMALASGIGEEVFFRGGMQTSLGLLATTLIFGLLHGLPGTRYAAWGAFALVVGLGLGLLRELEQGLWGPILAHVCINFVNLRRIVRSGPEPDPAPLVTDTEPTDHNAEEPVGEEASGPVEPGR